VSAARGTDADVVVIGAGIVGLATAAALARTHPEQHVLVLDKEAGPAHHQSGRNSGVIHSGLYYRPGSAKARLVARGRELLLARCREELIPHDVCGKVVVATRPDELGRLEELAGRADAHGLEWRRLDPRGLREVEPHAAGLAALQVPSAGIVDFSAVCASLADELVALGAEVRFGARVVGLDDRDDRVVVRLEGGDRVVAARAVNCSGLYSDRITRSAGTEPGATITPFRGEYHELRPEARRLVRHLVYPVPDPSFPFLGVHLTRSIDGGVHVGPNAVLALAREGYRWSDVDRRDVAEMLRDPGLRRLAARHWRTGSAEVVRSLSRRAFVRALQRLVPEVSVADLVRAPSGVRAQALSPEGDLLDDFAFATGRHTVHVVNAPSPAATASLAIGEEVARRVDALVP
jgi:L-2-hydroxyglutarate oxidase